MLNKCILIIFLFSINSASARVFNLHGDTSGTYLRGNYGSSNIQQDGYIDRSGSNTLMAGEVDFTATGEIGYFSVKGPVGFRLGLEVINPQKISKTPGSNSSGTKLMDISSEAYGIFPVLHIDYYLLPGKNTRAILSFGGGYGRVTLKNTYDLTTDGTTEYGITSFKESAEGYTYILETSFGYELTLANSLTVVFDAGYRYGNVNSLEYKNNVTNFLGNQNSGDAFKNSDGQDLELDLSSFYTGIHLRFYFNF